MTSQATPKVSVCVMTYNHARFIDVCLKSILEQETEFRFEVVIGDDCSTDGAGAIIDGYAAGDPKNIRVLRPEKNLGPTRNYLAIHDAARGEYVAHIDGDDFVLPGKIARQAAYLDRHADLVACGHAVGVVSEDGSPKGLRFPSQLAERFAVDQVVKCGMPFFNSSLMYRRAARAPIQPDFDIFDWYFLTGIMLNGEAGYLRDELGRYRVNSRSLTAALTHGPMRSRMLELYQRRLPDLPSCRPEFFAFALMDGLDCVRRGQRITRAHQRLLRESFDIRGFWKAFETFRWRWQNRRALAR